MDCNCKKIYEELAFLYVDNEMGQEMLIAFEAHIARCPPCAKEAKIIERLVMVLRERTGRCAAPSHLRERILAGLPHRRGQRT